MHQTKQSLSTPDSIRGGSKKQGAYALGSKMQNQKVNHRFQQQQQQQRPWGDWSECSVNCIRTRHRRICDDIVAAQQNITTATTNAMSTATTPASNDTINYNNSKRHPERKLRDDEDSRSKEDQFEEEDYADEGDEEDEIDPCDIVDASQTIQEQACVGGLCPMSMVDQALFHSKPMNVGGGKIVPETKRDRPNKQKSNRRTQQQQTPIKGPSSSVALVPPTGESVDATVGSTEQERLTYELNLQQQSSRYNNNRIKLQSKQHNRGEFAPDPENSSFSLVSKGDQEQQHSLRFNNTKIHLTASDKFNNSPSNQLSVAASANHSSSSTWTTRNMWPPTQLMGIATAGELGQQANLIQWTILFGSLLLIVLLIMLIVRKLFFSAFQPSYHWMLAKQTLKSTSKLSATAASSSSPASGPSSSFLVTEGGPVVSTRNLANPHHPLHRHHQHPFGLRQGHAHLACPTAVVIDSEGRAQHQPAITAHHMCYSMGSDKTCVSGGTGKVHQCIVDSQGRHLLEQHSGPGCSTKNRSFFNNNLIMNPTTNESYHLDLPHHQQGTNNNSLQSNSSSYTNTKTPPTTAHSAKHYQHFLNHQQQQSQNIIGASCNYDTLNSSSYGRQRHSTGRMDEDFIVTGDFVISSTSNNNNDNSLSTHHGSISGAEAEEANKSSTSSLQQDASNVFRRGTKHQNHSHQQTTSEASNSKQETKHRSPNVPETGEDSSIFRQQHDLFSRSGQKSGSSSVASADEEEDSCSNSDDASPSVQSTTAPMLSQAASSSFEQTPDLPLADCSAPSASTSTMAQINSTPNSSNASPAFYGLQKRHNRNNSISTKFANIPSNVVQSQPNSPMFVNQFVGARGNKSSGTRTTSTKRTRSTNKVSSIAKKFQDRIPKPLSEPSEGGNLQSDVDLEYTNQIRTTEVIEDSYQNRSTNKPKEVKKINQGIIVAGRGGNNSTTRESYRDGNDDGHFYEEIDHQI